MEVKLRKKSGSYLTLFKIINMIYYLVFKFRGLYFQGLIKYYPNVTPILGLPQKAASA